MRLLAEVAHKRHIPVTWVVDVNSARTFADDLTAWHESYGDEPLLMLDIAPIWETDADLKDSAQLAEQIVTMREKLPKYISSEWSKVQRVMEWAPPSVTGADWKTHVLIYALEQVGFRGLWGYHWEGTESDFGDDRGCPFGFFYPSTDHHNLGGAPSSRTVAIPHASLDLVEVGGPREGDTEQVEQANLQKQISSGRAQRTFNHYLSSAKWNRWLAYIQHIEAADLVELASEDLEQLDAYFAHVSKGHETQVMLLSQAVNDYQLAFDQTSPTFLLIGNDLEIDEDVPSSSPSHATLFYYDDECQLIFEKGKMEPIDMKNYVSPPTESRYGVEFNLPQIERFRPTRVRNKLRMHFALASTKAMPYAFAIWGNHEGLTLVESNAKVVKWLSDQILFVRIDLEPGNNDIEVLLTI